MISNKRRENFLTGVDQEDMPAVSKETNQVVGNIFNKK